MKLKLFLFLTLLSNILFAQNFHDTQGKIEISNSGATEFILPIAMPPSLKDVGPVINLNYASGQQSGIAGQGWSINSISAITRMSTRKDIDGFRDGVDFDQDDKLALDGQRLLLKSGSGSYWALGSEYETEVQSNTKIKLFGSGSEMYFIVTNPDGSRSWYGGVANSDTTSYYISRFEDTNGNFINYVYEKLLKTLCISEIQFSANSITNITPLNKVVFTYKTLLRKESGYAKGVKIEKGQLLDKIEVFTGGFLFKKYQLTHVSDSQGYQRISQLQEFNGANEPANPIQFEYKTTSNAVTENTTLYTDNFNLTANPDMSGDFDGDGRLDFIGGGKLYTRLFQGNEVTYPFPLTFDYSTKRTQFTATTITNNKVNQKQSIVKTVEALNNVTFTI